MPKSVKSSSALVLIFLSVGAYGQTLQPWMSPEVGAAWNQGFKGQNVTIKVVDDFSSGSSFSGNFGTGILTQQHGNWTLLEAGMIAPSASMARHDFSTGAAVILSPGLNVLNLSYGMYARRGFSVSSIAWAPEEQSIILDAKNSLAVVSKAAGNDHVAIGGVTSGGTIDYLNLALKGAPSAIYAGALDKNGTTSAKASLASYSNYAGSDTTVQKQFLVVGVAGNQTGLYGTSFAAPIVSGYAAILGSKFTSATSKQIVNQLLNTARTDTLTNYKASTYGRGEASLTRALAPVSIK